MLVLIALVGCEWLATDPLDAPYEAPTTRAVEGTTRSNEGIALPADRGKLTTDPTELGSDEPLKAGEKAEQGRRWNPVRVPQAGEVDKREDLTKARTVLRRPDGTPIMISGNVSDPNKSTLQKELEGARSSSMAEQIQIEIDTTNGTFRHED